MYTFQFGQYAWTHMILLVVFIPSSFFVSNIFDGLIWFLLPCSLVIINDIGAYLFGKSSITNSCPGLLGCRNLIGLIVVAVISVHPGAFELLTRTVVHMTET